MNELKQVEIEWDGKPLKIFLTNKPERLKEESFTQYKARRKVYNILLKARKKGVQAKFGEPTVARMKKDLKRAEQLDTENYEREIKHSRKKGSGGSKSSGS